MRPMAEAPPPTDRRRFFRRLVLGSLEGLESVAGAARGSELGPPELPPARFLRPPGALDEPDFAETCEQCAACVQACPADCIRLEPEAAGGRPFIVARTAPCVVCDTLACTHACPSGALEPLDDPARIRMGRAHVDAFRCLRTGPEAEPCTLCIDPCPEGERAIGLDGDGLVEVRDGCTGCGVCERACPTEPASIIVEPHPATLMPDENGSGGTRTD